MLPDYVRDIQASLENKCYYSALSLALALPDMCGCAEYPNNGVAERYITWYDAMLGDEEKQQRGNNNASCDFVRFILCLLQPCPYILHKQ